MTTAWGRHDERQAAIDRILDAAGHLYVDNGVDATTMADIASAAGCSRATLYLYFPNKPALRAALRDRATLAIAAETLAGVAGIADPSQRLAEAMITAIERVRAAPELMVWFTPTNVALTNELAYTSDLVTAVATALSTEFGVPDEHGALVRARLLIRTIVSFLTAPGIDGADERAQIERLVTPALVSP